MLIILIVPLLTLSHFKPSQCEPMRQGSNEDIVINFYVPNHTLKLYLK